MIFTNEQISQIEKLAAQHPVIKILWEEYSNILTDPSKKLSAAIMGISNTVADDLDLISRGEIVYKMSISEEGEVPIESCNLKLLGASKDDKLFDRVMVTVKEHARFLEAIRTGRIDLTGQIPEDVKKKSPKKGESTMIPV